ncbi:MAG: cysteine-rich CWC family protein [Hyphomicrobiales bacterium]|nr:cysteine-rich CWC family protein [Alphaproteobacteria bacterium]
MITAPTDSRLPLRRLACARCGTSFECDAAGGACWCMDETYRLPMPDAAGADCLCAACLRAAATVAGLSL